MQGQAAEKRRAREILDIFNDLYGTDLKCYLDHADAAQLLIATMLSAQCTDARVNMVTKDLFVKYPDIRAFASADLSELEKDIFSTGFYHNKAKNIIAMAKTLCEKYAGEVPQTIEELTALPGVGRKTANVVLGNIFHKPSIVVDTHVKRISKRLGLTGQTDPEKVEYDLMKVLPEEAWILYNFQVIAFGREICRSQNPDCGRCPFTGYCVEYKKR